MAAYARALLSVIAISITLEVLWTGGISRPPTVLYHLWHIGLMLFVLAVRLAYQRQLSPKVAKYSLVLIVGMAFATVGDVVNSAISGIEPISRKLSAAVILFGIAYGLYAIVLYKFAAPRLRAYGGFAYRARWLIVAVVAAANTATWVLHIRNSVQGHHFLEVGSFLFNLIIYTALISFSIWYFWADRFSLLTLAVLIGGLLIPVSDLYLFFAWLPSGQDSNVPGFDLYALNWILYFGGQVLFAFLPVAQDSDSLPQRT